jgi:predicted RNA-binding Zn ribbon-like protein
MRKQQTAPGELELVRAFVNTIDIEQGTEQLAGPAGLAAWLEAHDLLEPGAPPTTADVRRAVNVRESIRAILLTHTDSRPVPAAAAQTLDDASARARIRLRFDERCVGSLEPAAGGVDGALGRLLSIIHESDANKTWRRLKACREHTCAWAFYDHTKNRSGTWCNMEVCGNRAKARAYRGRRGGSE